MFCNSCPLAAPPSFFQLSFVVQGTAMSQHLEITFKCPQWSWMLNVIGILVISVNTIERNVVNLKQQLELEMFIYFNL